MKRRLIDYLDLLLAPAVVTNPQAAWRPAADVYRCESGWLVKFDLAGVRQEDITVRVDGAAVIVAGTRRDWRVYRQQEAQSMEIAYSRFERSVELAEEIMQAELRTEYRDGMLLVHVLVRREHAG
jgi:HSP20 family protein